jgi:hypothetical protein
VSDASGRQAASTPKPRHQDSAVQAPRPEDRQKEVLEEKQRVTARISETTRYAGFGLLAIFYAAISSAEPFPRHLATAYATPLRVMALCGVLAVLFDYLQYVCGRVAVQKALDREDKPFAYNKNWLSYRGRALCFWAKQAATLVGCLILVAIVATTL